MNAPEANGPEADPAGPELAAPWFAHLQGKQGKQ